MADYKQLGNYILFDELNPDSIGKNFRAGELENQKIKNHFILSEVHPMLYTNPKAWKRVSILLEGIKKSNITGLYSPDKILTMGEKQMLIFPHKELMSFDSVLEDSAAKGIPINFDLAFSIATAISDLLDIGSSIVISGKKSFHGFLTPDNILIDFEGKIYLKNYGIFPYLDTEEEIFSGLEKQYGSWLTPEFHRREKVVPQSDVYHLGYLLFKMLTGQYFSYNPGEDFDAKLANISFSQHIHESNKDFISGLQEFFKKTLHPDPSMRFSGSREFKEFISRTFNIEELSSVTFNLAYFMDSLYAKERSELQENIESEKLYSPPVKPSGVTDSGTVDTELVETILSGLEEKQKGSPKLLMIIGAIIIAAIAIGAFMFVQSNKAKQEKLMKAEKIKLEMEREQREQDLLNQLKAIEDRAAQTEEEKKKQEEEKLKLQSQIDEVQKEKERTKKLEEEKQKKAEEEAKLIKEAADKKKKADEEARQKKADEEKKRLEEIERKKKAEEALKPKRGELLPVTEVDKKPVRISGRNPVFPPSVRSKYSGNRFEARVMCLVDENGTVKSSRVLNSVPKEIKKAIEKSLLKWKFSPAVKRGVQVSVWNQVNLKVSI
ncbi:MAG: protein kinase [Acidobacteriota bacterium]